MVDDENARRRLESKAGELFGFSEAVLFGRARSGLAAIVDLIGEDDGIACLMPSNICPSIFAAGLAASATVVPVDVDTMTGLPSDAAFVAAMQNSGKPGLVMVTHLYGFARDYPKTIALAKQDGWFVLENDTSAARLSDCRGDAVLVSFGAGKVIDGGVGGAVLTDNENLASALRETAITYPPLDDIAETVERELMVLRRNLRAAGDTSAYESFLDREISGVCYRLPDGVCPPIERAIGDFAGERSRRLSHWREWTDLLSPLAPAILLPDCEPSTPWRIMARVPRHREPVVRALREAGVDVGTNYPPLHDFFPDTIGGEPGEGAVTWGNEVVNFWLTGDYDKNRKIRTVELIDAALTSAISDAL